MSLSSNVIEQLKKHSVVPDYISERQYTTNHSILISPVKLYELISSYETIYNFTHTIWRNMPNVPDSENAFVLVWMLAADGYDVSHLTVKWEGSSSNTLCTCGLLWTG